MKSVSFLLGFAFLLNVCIDKHASLWAAKVVDAEDETIDIEDLESNIETANDIPEPAANEEVPPEKEQTGSSNVDLTILFTKPSYETPVNLEFPAGQVVELLIGFENKGSFDFTIEELEGSLRYAMDFTYRIQNFSTIKYEQIVPAGSHYTLFYSFAPSDSFASRPFGLSIGLSYKDENKFIHQVYNETITIVEVEEGLDGETLFLYIFLAAGVVLLLVIGQQFLYSVNKSRVGSLTKKQAVQLETGTKKSSSIDYDFIPKNMLDHINKSKGPTKPKSNGVVSRKSKKTVDSDS